MDWEHTGAMGGGALLQTALTAVTALTPPAVPRLWYNLRGGVHHGPPPYPHRYGL